MIIIVDSKEHADKYVEAGLVDEFVEIELPGGRTPEEWKAAWDANKEANWGKGKDDEADGQGDSEAAGSGEGA